MDHDISRVKTPAAVVTVPLDQSGANMRSKTLPPPPEWAISQALGVESIRVSWLAGDGSDRCYYRLHDKNSEKTFVLMQLSGDDATLLAKDGYEWVKISALLADHEIPAPRTIAALPDFAALIIEDYGDVMMETFALEALQKGQRSEVLQLYHQAFGMLGHFLEITEAGRSHWRERSFDAARLDWELHFFKEQFLEAVLEWTFTADEAAAFKKDARALAEWLAERSHYFVHRDFHSRNIMIKDKNLAVIDFQDARLGPPTYDLVSLCFDSYIPLTSAERRALIKQGIQALMATNRSLEKTDLEDEIGPMLLQRQIKAIGSFGYLTVKKNRGNYLRNIAPALATLDADLIEDSRWPFLSKTLIQEIKRRWQERGAQ
jgi:aminoglycoside/choline kinase family phosphotransferase